MDLQDLKDIIQKEGGKVIIVENDKPQMVVMAFDEWRGKKNPASSRLETEQPVESAREPEIVGPANGLTIDDLPL